MKHFSKKLLYALVAIGGFFGLHTFIRLAPLPLMIKVSLVVFLCVTAAITLIGLLLYATWAAWHYRTTPALLLFLLSLAVVGHTVVRWITLSKNLKEKNLTTLLTLMFDKGYIPSEENSPAIDSTTKSTGEKNNSILRKLSTKVELDSLLANTQQGVIVKIFATWCPPCQQIKPVYLALAQELGDKVTFVEIDSDAFQGIKDLNIEYLPSFIGYKNGKELFRFTSPSPEFLRQEINKLL